MFAHLQLTSSASDTANEEMTVYRLSVRVYETVVFFPRVII